MMRDKRRYIFVSSSSKIPEFEREDFEQSFYNALIGVLGEPEYFKANPKIMKFRSENDFILRVSLKKYNESIVALTFIKSMDGKPVSFYTLGASGTIKALQSDSG